MKIQALSRRLRTLAILTMAAVGLLMLSGTALADEDTTFGDDRFEVIQANSGTAYFSVRNVGDCDDTDENCAIKVTGSPTAVSNQSWEVTWANALDDEVGNNSCVDDSNATDDENMNFEICMTGLGYEVAWPIIEPDDDFEATPHCESNDDVCSVTLAVCYNAKDCNPETARDEDDFTEVSEFWQDAGSCLYDDDEEDVWECIDDAFQDWLDDELSSRDDYDDFIDELEDEYDDAQGYGFSVEDYEDDLNDVGGSGSSSSSSNNLTTLQQYQRDWNLASPRSLYLEESEVETTTLIFRPSQDDYLTIDFTGYLEYSSPIQVCNTTVGCFSLMGQSSFFRQYLQGFHLLIRDSTILRCMDRRGWDTDDDHQISMNNPDLMACDERFQEAVQYCPSENTGAEYELFLMYDIGLLRGVLSDQYAQSLRTNLERDRLVAPECLCAVGFLETEMIVATHTDADPWSSLGTRRVDDVCD